MLSMSAVSPRNFWITLISTTVTVVNIVVSFQLLRVIILTVLQRHQVSHNGKSIQPLNQQEQSAEEQNCHIQINKLQSYQIISINIYLVPNAIYIWN